MVTRKPMTDKPRREINGESHFIQAMAPSQAERLSPVEKGQVLRLHINYAIVLGLRTLTRWRLMH